MPTSDSASEQTLGASDTADRDTDNMCLYALLGVERSATKDEIKRAYRRLALVYHPDRNISGRQDRRCSSTNASSNSEVFVRIQYAYDILSDDRKRRIYDRYGEMGVRMAGRVGGGLLDPLVSSLLSTFAFGSAVLALLLIVLFAFLSRRIDHHNSFPYAVVFVPLWIIDLLIVVGIVWFAMRNISLVDAGDEQENQDAASIAESENSDGYDNVEQNLAFAGYSSTATTDSTAALHWASGSHQADGPNAAASPQSTNPSVFAPTAKTPLLSSTAGENGESGANGSRRKRSYRRQRRRLHKLRTHIEYLLGCLAKPAPLVCVLLEVVFQVILVLQLDGHVNWSVWYVAAPLLCVEAIHFILLTLQLIAAVCLASERELRTRSLSPSSSSDLSDTNTSTASETKTTLMPFRHICVMAADTYWWLAIRVSLALLITSKLNPLGIAAGWSWIFVFAPAYLPFVRWAVTLFLLRQRLQSMSMEEVEIAQNKNAIVAVCVAAFVVACSFLYSFVALLIWKLSAPQAIRMCLVLIPVFVVLSLGCCFCSCVSLCLSYGISATLDEEQRMESCDSSDSGLNGQGAGRANSNSASARSSSASSGGGRLVPANRRIE
ncbi:hypothetical protein BX070DRAFT_231668 [Coemansia spiralis]|nr:hypothetical protein BX070DRAFT_231668 [Coemansia spiralis]